MPELKFRKFAENITATNLIDTKFKTMRISINMVVPLDMDYASLNALFPNIVTRVTKDYPDYRSLSRYLSSLYGASLSTGIFKIGDNQVLNFAVSGISNKYALENENMAARLTDLLCSAVFDPLTDDDGYFPEESIHQEKRQLIETLDANFSDKKSYAMRRCLEIFYEGEPAAVSRYGTRESVKKADRESVMNAWVKVMREARIELFVSGDCDFSSVCRTFASYLDFDRSPVILGNRITLSVGEVKEVTESMKVVQSKLVMAFRTGVTQEDSAATKVMSVLFGGSSTSKLFMNVREKMSLCYYCHSRVSDVKGAMFVESGVETANIEAAKAAILEQLQDVRDGKFTDDDLRHAKLAMINSYRSVGDSLYAMENWYLNQIFNNEVISAPEMSDVISRITRVNVIEAARKVKLDTVYVLKGEN